MKSITQLTTGLAALLLAYVAGTHSPATSVVPQGPYATVDMENIINDFADKNVLFDNLKNERRTRDQALDTEKEKIEAQMQSLAIMRQGTKEYIELSKAIELDKRKLDLDDRANRLWFTNEKGKIVKEIYKKALDVIEAYAKENGILAVHLRTKGELPTNSYEEVSNAIIVRSLVWANEAIDITDKIAERMKK